MYEPFDEDEHAEGEGDEGVGEVAECAGGCGEGFLGPVVDGVEEGEERFWMVGQGFG